MKVCLANDSFPPQIDGVANTIKNYAYNIQENHGSAIVTTPSYKYNEDELFPFPIVRYPSFPLWKSVGYNVGYPFNGKSMEQLVKFAPDVIHSHCPMISQYVCRELRCITNKPLIFTYHTKFDVDIKKCLKFKLLEDIIIDAMISNIEASDEVWVVSKGAGDNLKSMGFAGDVIVMPNGVDIPKRPPNLDILKRLRQEYGLTDESVPVFISVGRMKWYKGHRITIDALKRVKDSGYKFKMLFVGCGSDEDDIKKYAEKTGLKEECVFTGAILDREDLRNHYFLGDLFLFPSTYDTNGIVVREAAACNVPSVIIKDSCASEGVEAGRNGFIINEDPDSMAQLLIDVCNNREMVKAVGENAGNDLYLSWTDSVANAAKRYEEVMKHGITTTKPNLHVDNKGMEFVKKTYIAMKKMKAIFSETED